jgi:hypothetical protein
VGSNAAVRELNYQKKLLLVIGPKSKRCYRWNLSEDQF